MEGKFKSFMFKRTNTEKTSQFPSERESSSQLFSTWNTLDTSFDDEGIGSNKTRTAQSLYLDDEDEEHIIPDIDELRDQDFIQQTADAPNVEINRLDNLEELDKKIKKTPFLSTTDNVDLAILAKHIVSEEKVRENDIEWTWDKLITDVMYNADIVKMNKKVAEESSKNKE